MMHGLPATGKSTIAKEIQKNLPNSVILKSATYRPIKHNTSYFDETLSEISQQKDEAYKTLINDAKKAISAGKIPILDATFHKKHRRNWVYKLEKDGITIKILSTRCSDKTITKRIGSRKNKKNADSMLNQKKAFDIMKLQADPLTKDENTLKTTLKINTDKPVDSNEVLNWLKTISS